MVGDSQGHAKGVVFSNAEVAECGVVCEYGGWVSCFQDGPDESFVEVEKCPCVCTPVGPSEGSEQVCPCFGFGPEVLAVLLEAEVWCGKGESEEFGLLYVGDGRTEEGVVWGVSSGLGSAEVEKL